MQFHIIVILINIILIFVIGCNYDCHSLILQKNNTKSIILDSYNYYDLLTKNIKKELYLIEIDVVNRTDVSNVSLPILQIIKVEEHQQITPFIIFNNVKEYQITLFVQAKILIPEETKHVINVKVNRSFFDISSVLILAKDSEKNLIQQEMYQQIAQLIISKLLFILNNHTLISK